MGSLKKAVAGRLSEYQKAALTFLAQLATRPRHVRPPRSAGVICCEDLAFDAEGDVSGISVIFSCSSGVFLLDTDRGLCRRVLSGQFYGLTRMGDEWLVARSNRYGERKRQRSSDISLVALADARVSGLRSILYGLPRQVHQIAIIREALQIPHSGFNELLSIDVRKVESGTRPLTIFACDKQQYDIPTPSHLNSIYYSESSDEIYIVAHNRTAQTGRASSILICDRDGVLKTVKETDADSAHNVFVDQEDLYYCDSKHRALVRNEEVLFEADKLLRGLSVSADRMLVGGSEVCLDRSRRMSSDPTIFVLDRAGGQVGRIDFAGLGDIYEIRQWRGPDEAMNE